MGVGVGAVGGEGRVVGTCLYGDTGRQFKTGNGRVAE